METVANQTQEVIEGEVRAEGHAIIAFAEGFQITDTDSLIDADRLFHDWSAKEKERFIKFDEGRKKSYEIYQWNLKLLKEATEPYAKARKILGDKIAAERSRLERLRIEEEARLNAIAQAEALAAKQAEADAALAAAAALEKAGDTDQAEALLKEAENIVSAPVQAPPVTVKSSIPEMKSVGRKIWKWKVVDESQIKEEYFIPRTRDDSAIGARVRAKGKDAERIVGGIFCWQEETTTSGRG